MRDYTGAAVLAALLMAGTAVAAYAQIAISANDSKLKLVDGKAEVQKGAPADTVTVIDMRVTPPKVLAELNVPNSVVGPPTNVAIGAQGRHRPRFLQHDDRSGRSHQANPRRQGDGDRPDAAESRASSVA